MFRNKNLATSKQIIDSLLESGQIKKREGSIVFSKKEGRKTTAVGKLYLRDELIYAASISTKDTPIGKRVATGGLVPMDDLQAIIRSTKNNPSSPEIVDLLLSNHLINEKALLLYVKEQAIDQISEIFSWGNVLGEWHPMTTTKEFMIPYVSFQKMRELLEKQESLHNEFAHLTEKFFRKEEIALLTFTLTQSELGEVSNETKIVSSFCDNKHTISAISEKTGLTEYKVFQTLMLLWKNNLAVLHLSAIQVPFSSVIAAQKFTLGAKTQEDIDNTIPLININVPVTTHIKNPVDPIVEFEEVEDDEENDLEEAIDKDKETTEAKHESNATIETVMAEVEPDKEQVPIVIEEPAIIESTATVVHNAEDIENTTEKEIIATEKYDADAALASLLQDDQMQEVTIPLISNTEVPNAETADSEILETKNPVDETFSETLADEEAESDDSFLLFTQTLEKLQHDLDKATDEWDISTENVETLSAEHENLAEKLAKLANLIEKAQAKEAAAKLHHDDIYEQLQTTINSFTFTDDGEV